MNSFGTLFRVTLCGESHGPGILVCIEGLPAGLHFEQIDFKTPLARRRKAPLGTTPRQENDTFEVLTGVYQGHCTGAPVTLFVPNQDVKSENYIPFHNTPRPGHVDWIGDKKYAGYADMRGSGIFSGRLTVGLVLAGTLAAACLAPLGIRAHAHITEIGGQTEGFDQVIAHAIQAGDSLGGVVSCSIEGVPVGCGEPFFDSLESLLSHGLFSIPGVRGVAFGNGWEGARMPGSLFNDALAEGIEGINGKTTTNHAGGIVGGLSNGNPLEFQVAFRPPASIQKKQKTIDLRTGERVSLEIGGRHDVCFVQRCPVIVESVALMVLYDLCLRTKTSLPNFDK